MGLFTSSHVEAVGPAVAVIASSNEPLLFLAEDLSELLRRALRFAGRAKLARQACRGVSFPNSAQANRPCQSSYRC